MSKLGDMPAPNSLYPDQLFKTLEGLWERKMPLMIEGPPGIGKSAIPRQFCKRTIGKNSGKPLQFCDVRLLLHNPADFNFPIVDQKKLTVKWVNSIMPSKDREPDWEGIIMLDEITQCSTMLQSVSLQILHERRCGSEELPDGAWVIAAGNRPKDGTASHKLISSAANRMVITELLVDTRQDGAWHQWAREHDVHPLIRYYLHKVPDSLHRFDPKSPEVSYPSPRSWGEGAHAIVSSCAKELWPTLLCGSVGQGETPKFMAFVKYHDQVPDPMEILNNPKAYKPAQDMSILYATMASLSGIAKHVDDRLLNSFGIIAKAVPKEFGIMLMRDLVVVKPDCIKPSKMPKDIQDWLTQNRDVLITVMKP